MHIPIYILIILICIIYIYIRIHIYIQEYNVQPSASTAHFGIPHWSILIQGFCHLQNRERETDAPTNHPMDAFSVWSNMDAFESLFGLVGKHYPITVASVMTAAGTIPNIDQPELTSCIILWRCARGDPVQNPNDTTTIQRWPSWRVRVMLGPSDGDRNKTRCIVTCLLFFV